MGQRAQRVRIAQPLQATPPKLLAHVRPAIRTRHYSIRTEEAYVRWIRRSILFHNKRHPAEMAESEISQFLTHLGTHSKWPYSGSYWRHSSSSHQRWVVGQFLSGSRKKENAKYTGKAFYVGTYVGFVFGLLAFLGEGGVGTAFLHSTLAGIVAIGTGLAIVVFLVRQWSDRPRMMIMPVVDLPEASDA